MISSASSQSSYLMSPEAIFISHATEDGDFVQTLVGQLKQKGFEVWHQPKMTPGGNYMKEIEARLNSCKAGVVIWSRSSVKKEYVQAEANYLRERECLVPVYIEECRPPAVFSLIQGIKCRKERSLAKEELLALCEAVNKIFGLRSSVLSSHYKPDNSTIRSRIARALPALHVRDLLIGIVLGVSVGYLFFQWSQSPAKADLEEFTKIAKAVLPAGDINPKSIFPDSGKPIAFIRDHSSHPGWPTTIVAQWDQHYQVQKQIAMMFCSHLNDLKLEYRRAYLTTRKSDHLKQENFKTPQEPGINEATQTLSIDRNRVLSELFDTTRCLGDAGSSAPFAEALMRELDR